MKRFAGTHVRGVDINGVWHRISRDDQDRWIVKYNSGTGEVVREFGCKRDTQYFLDDRKNRKV